MQPITAPAPPSGSGRRPRRGRWIWRLAGAATIAGLSVLTGVWIIAAPPGSPDAEQVQAVPTRTVTFSQPVTTVDVTSYGGPITIARGPAGPLSVTEAVMFDQKGPPPAVVAQVSHGVLTLAAPSCARASCSVGFTVTVPGNVAVRASSGGGALSVSGAGSATLDSGGGPLTARGTAGTLTATSEGGQVTVHGAGSANLDSGSGNVNAAVISGPVSASSEGGNIQVQGAATANLDSGGGSIDPIAIRGVLTATSEGGAIFVTGSGPASLNSGSGPVHAVSVNGSLTATTDGGDLMVNQVTGPLSGDTGGGTADGEHLDSPTAQVSTNGGSAVLDFDKAPQSVEVTTSSGPAQVAAPGGPYAVSAESFGGSQRVTIPVSQSAASTISVNTSGGSLVIEAPNAGT